MPRRSPAPPTINMTSASRSAATCWAWLIASPTSRRPHSDSREVAVGSCLEQCADLPDGELGITGVGQGLVDQRPGRLVDIAGHLPVEVGRQPVADIGLDQRFAPGARFGPGVEGLDRGHERRHGLLRVDAKLGDPVHQPSVVAHLDRRLLRQRGSQRGARGHPGVVRHPVEGAQLAVGQHSEQVDHGGEIGLVGLGHGGCGPLGTAALANGQRRWRRPTGKR